MSGSSIGLLAAYLRLALTRPKRAALALAVWCLRACWWPVVSSPHRLRDAEPAVIISPNDDRDYDLIELANGLEVILVSDPNAEKSAAALSIGLGAASDPEEYPGMAHYLEHMLFMGSRSSPSPTASWRLPLSTAA